MKKRILTSAVALASFSVLTIPTIASADYTYRVPIYQSDIDRNYGSDTGTGGGTETGGGDTGTGGGTETGGGETDPTTDPAYCDLDQNLVDQWNSAGVTDSMVTDNGTFQNPTLFFISRTNGLNGTELPQYPTKCFNSIEMYDIYEEGVDSYIYGLGFLNNVTKGDSISIGSFWGIDDFSGLQNIQELNTLFVNPDFSQIPSVKIPESAWLCQPGQSSVFTGIPQAELCDIQEEEEEVVLGPWPQFAEDNNLPYSDWNDTEWYGEGLTYIPTEPYPISSLTGDIRLFNNSITDITGLSSITNIDGRFNILGNDITSLDPISNLTVGDRISIPSSYSGNKLASDTIFCEQNDASKFDVAAKSNVCETGGTDIDLTYKKVYAPREKLGLWFKIEEGVDLNEQFTLTLTSSNGEIVVSDFLDDMSDLGYIGVGLKRYVLSTTTDTSIDISSIYAIEEDLTIKIDALGTDGNLVSKTTTAYMEDNAFIGNTRSGFSTIYNNPDSSYESSSEKFFDIAVAKIDFSQPVSFIIEALDSSGNVITEANNISGDVYFNTDGTISSMTSNAPDYFYEGSMLYFATNLFGTPETVGSRVTASATNTKGKTITEVILESDISQTEEQPPEEPTVVDGFVAISDAVINDNKQLSFNYNAGGDVSIDISQGLEIVLSSSLGDETFYEYYRYGNVSNYDLAGIYVPNEDLNIQLSYIDENGTAGQDTATVLMPEVVEETGGTANVIEGIVAGFADNRYEISLSSQEIDITQPVQVTAYLNDYQGAVDMGFGMDQVYFEGEVVFDDSNMIISNTVNSSSNFSNVVQISTGNIDLIKQYTDTDSLIVDIVATDTSGNTVTQQDSLAL